MCNLYGIVYSLYTVFMYILVENQCAKIRQENIIREKGGGIESKLTEEYVPLHFPQCFQVSPPLAGTKTFSTKCGPWT